MITTESYGIVSRYSSMLNDNQATYSRSENSTYQHFYEAIDISVKTSGFYIFISESNMDTSGALYNGYFYLTYPLFNLFQENDDGAGNEQFYIKAYLDSNVKYILVATTFGELVTVQFTIIATSPDNVKFLPNQYANKLKTHPQYLKDQV
ncbi:unnamed protein product [Rotaria magnacalcarata]